MGEIILKGHRVVKGKAEGEALVSDKAFAFMSLLDMKTAVVIEKGSPWEGISIAGKILVFPIAKGSTANSSTIFELARLGIQPKAIINLKADPAQVSGAIISNIPMVDRLDGNPIELIKTGDHVEVDADNGIVRVRSRESVSK